MLLSGRYRTCKDCIRKENGEQAQVAREARLGLRWALLGEHAQPPTWIRVAISANCVCRAAKRSVGVRECNMRVPGVLVERVSRHCILLLEACRA